MKSALSCLGKGESWACRGIRKGEGGVDTTFADVQHQAAILPLRVGIPSLNAGIRIKMENKDSRCLLLGSRVRSIGQHPRMVRKKSHGPCHLMFPLTPCLAGRPCKQILLHCLSISSWGDGSQAISMVIRKEKCLQWPCWCRTLGLLSL